MRPFFYQNPRTGNVPLAPYSVSEVLNDVGNSRCSVILIKNESTPHGMLLSYLLTAYNFGGEPVRISLRVVLANPSDKRITFSIPGGAGVFRDDILIWLASLFKENHACIDWVTRGQSPAHGSISCIYDPLFVDGASYADSFMYHNVQCIWAAINWLFSEGYEVGSIIGGSWGGVKSLLVASLEPRIKRAYSTFGSGGFFLPHVGRRNLWDDALSYLGPQKSCEWFRAFDPLLRLSNADTFTYLESATNDKFFSLGMIQATWKEIKNKNCIAFAHNQDHSMSPYGKQPYVLEHFDKNSVDTTSLRAFSNRTSAIWEAGDAVVALWPWRVESGEVELLHSAQAARVSDMSRAWKKVAPNFDIDGGVTFQIDVTNLDAEVVYYAKLVTHVAGHKVRVCTPLHRTTPRERGVRKVQAAALVSTLFQFEDGPLEEMAIADKINPKVEKKIDSLKIDFSREVAYQRVTFCGLQNWVLLKDWKFIGIECHADNFDQIVDALSIFVSKNFMRTDEKAYECEFSRAIKFKREGRLALFFAREEFSPATVREMRFLSDCGTPDISVLTEFDAVGVVSKKKGTRCEFCISTVRLLQALNAEQLAPYSQ